MKEKIKFFGLVWLLGSLGELLFLLLRITRRIIIKGYQKRKFSQRKGLIIISNHPSLIEPGILPLLFFPQALFFLKSIPLSTPDNKNFYKKRWFSFLRPFCIPVERGSRRKELRTLKKLREIINQGRTLILFPEGGRTFKRKEFRISESGEKLGKFLGGLRRLFLNIDCRILPIWVRGTDKILPNKFEFSEHRPFFRLWKKAEIVIGEVIESETLPQDKRLILKHLEDSLLSLSGI